MINKELLQKRLNAFYINWIQHKELWGDSDIIVIHNTNISNSKSSNFLSWLLGDDFVFFDETISANKPMVQDQNMQGKGCEDKFTPVIDGKMDNSISSTSSVMDVTSETYERDYSTSSSRKDSVILDHDNDDEDWMLIEGKEEGQERKLANKFSWKRWIMDKTTKSFGFRDLRKINASH